MTGHPEKDGTYALSARSLFWPNMSCDVRQFVRNCLVCRSSTSWRDHRHGLLSPLPVPPRMWREIFIDFVTGILESQGCTNLLVISDRLSKGVILAACQQIDTEALTGIFLNSLVRGRGFPSAITSDRGPQFVGPFWTRLCQLLNI